MSEGLNGATRLHVIIGDPIAQVQAPAGITRSLVERGLNAVLVPVHVSAGDVDACIRGLSLARNLDSIVATVPHKFIVFRHCATATERARFLESVNAMRRNADGSWHGDMLDGLGFVEGIRRAGCVPEGKRALQVGAGGAGTAIALALLEAGVASLALHDADTGRRDRLIARLRGRFGDRVREGSPDPTGFDLVVNATPAGMRPEDPLPLLAESLAPGTFVGDVITAPEITPLLAAARARGCGTQTGIGMFTAVRDMIVTFLLAE